MSWLWSLWLILAVFVGYCLYYGLSMVRKPTVRYTDTRRNQEIVAACPTLRKNYFPSFIVGVELPPSYYRHLGSPDQRYL